MVKELDSYPNVDSHSINYGSDDYKLNASDYSGAEDEFEDEISPEDLKARDGQRDGLFYYLKVGAISLGLIFFGTLQIVAFKRLGYSLGPYPYYILLTVSFMFVPIYFVGVSIIHFSSRGFDPATTTLEFKKHFFIIGCCNGMNGILLLFANPHTPGIIQSIFSQSIIPFVMIISFFFLKTKFSLFQYMGAVIIVIGVLIDIIPEFTGDDEDDDVVSDGDGDEISSNVVWWFVFLSGEIPAAAQSVYQEKALGQAKLNVVYMMAWASLAQFCFLVVCFPLNFIPKFGGIAPDDVTGYFYNASICFAKTEKAPEECDGAALWLMLSMLSMLLAQFFQALVIKYSSATLSVLLLTAIVPLSAICFTFTWIMGDNAESFTPYTYASLVLVVIGIVIYRFMRRDKPPVSYVCPRKRDEEKKMLLVSGEGEEEEEEEEDGEDDLGALSTRVGLIDVDAYNPATPSHDENILFEHTIPAPQTDDLIN